MNPRTLLPAALIALTAATTTAQTPVDAAQYLPLATPWVLKPLGITTRSTYPRLALSQITGTIIMASSVYTLKHTIHATRPDQTDNHSFPSGHTAWAYLGATSTAIQLSQTSPWYPLGAYTLASTIATARITAHRHRPIDTAAGSAIGILSATAGHLITNLITHTPTNLPPLTGPNTPTTRLSLANRLSIPLRRHTPANPAWHTDLTLSLPLSHTRLSWALQATLTAQPTHHHTQTHTAAALTTGIDYTPLMRQRWHLTATLLAGATRTLTHTPPTPLAPTASATAHCNLRLTQNLDTSLGLQLSDTYTRYTHTTPRSHHPAAAYTIAITYRY